MYAILLSSHGGGGTRNGSMTMEQFVSVFQQVIDFLKSYNISWIYGFRFTLWDIIMFEILTVFALFVIKIASRYID